MDVSRFQGLPLKGGFLILEVRLVSGPLVDAIGRPAFASTRISAGKFRVELLADQTDEELSVSLYHEVLEAAAVGAVDCPAQLLDFNEGDFEQAAKSSQARLGPVTPEHLNTLLEEYGF